mgnify:CR=1 FL=1
MNAAALRSVRLDPVEQTYGRRDACLYALSVGFGADPMDPGQLKYVHGEAPGVLPSMLLVLASPGFWLMDSDLGVDWRSVVLARQRFSSLRPLPPSARVTSRLRVSGVLDCGPQRGALIRQERQVVDAMTGEVYGTVENDALSRNDGGFDPHDVHRPHPVRVPATRADVVVDVQTLPQSALMFDLHGIVNPIHSSPAAAAAAGFPRPILHGLCTMGFTHHALLRGLAAYDGGRVPEMSMEFLKVVFPGDRLRVSAWVAGEEVVYAVDVPDRSRRVATGTARLVGGRP